jgi:uncharacterized protein YxjI
MALEVNFPRGCIMLNNPPNETARKDHSALSLAELEAPVSGRELGRRWPGTSLLMMLALAGLGGCESPTPPAANPAIQSNRSPALPPDFEMKEKFLSIGTDLAISSGNGSHGRVEQRVMNLGKTFEYFDGNGALKASARQKVLSWGVEIEIFDEHKNKIGTVKEEVLKNLFSIKSYYLILDAQGRTVAESAKLDLLATNIEMKDKSGKIVVTMKRPAFNLVTDKWTVSVKGEIDKRLVVFVPAYKTSADNERD